MEVRCKKCGTVFEALVDEGALCPICRRFGAGESPDLEAPPSTEDEQANACASHPGNKAKDVCSRCGNFMCHLCVIRVGRKKVCPSCFNLLYSQDKVYVRRASFGERLGAMLIDCLVLLVIILIVSFIFALAVFARGPEDELSILLMWLLVFGLWSFYEVGMWTFGGATLGKRAVGIKVVGPERKSPSLLRSLIRYGMYWVSAFPFFLGFLWAGWEHRSRTWHDLVANTEVIKVRTKPL